jgi:hypothetical protein
MNELEIYLHFFGDEFYGNLCQYFGKNIKAVSK